MENTNKKPTAEQLKAWREQYGKVFTLNSEDEINGETLLLVIKKPSRASFERFQDEALKKGAKTLQQFVKENILFPEKEKVNEIFSDKPGLVSVIAEKLQDLMGLNVSFTMTES